MQELWYKLGMEESADMDPTNLVIISDWIEKKGPRFNMDEYGKALQRRLTGDERKSLEETMEGIQPFMRVLNEEERQKANKFVIERVEDMRDTFKAAVFVGYSLDSARAELSSRRAYEHKEVNRLARERYFDIIRIYLPSHSS